VLEEATVQARTGVGFGRRLRLLYTSSTAKYDFGSVVSSTTAIFTTTHDWVRREYVTPPPDHGIYQLIGQVAAGWSRLEHALDRIIWTLAGSSILTAPASPLNFWAPLLETG
jgi:hypothetical protein